MIRISEFFTKAAAFFTIFVTDALLPSVIILVAGILAIRLLLKLASTALEKSRLDKDARDLIKGLLKVMLYVLLGLIVAEKLGFDTTGIVALASVLTLAISLSVQNALTNVIGGFALLSTKPFKTGDYVEIAGRSGSVITVGLTYTRLSTADNRIVSIPNSAVVSAEIVNHTASGSRRVDIAVSASYGAPPDAVLEALKEAAQVDTRLPDKEPFAAVKNYGHSAIEYILQLWTPAADYWTTLYAVNKRVKEVFDTRGIEMTYPHLNVHLDRQ